MASEDPEETFKVTDRRRRAQDDEPTRPAPPNAPPPRAERERSRPAREPERSLTGLFMMLASSGIGRAAGRGRGEISGGAVSLKKKKKKRWERSGTDGNIRPRVARCRGCRVRHGSTKSHTA